MSSMLWSPQARYVQTTVPCLLCDGTLKVTRACHDVQVQCQTCGEFVPLREAIARADEAMEHFLEEIYCDRM